MTDRPDTTTAPPEEPKEPYPAVETSDGVVIPVVEEERAPPLREVGFGTWVRENLVPDARNAVLTVVFGALIAYIAYKTAWFVLVSGRWRIIEVNLTTLMVGRFPRSELWRIVASALTFAAVLPLWAGTASRRFAELATGRTEGGGWRTRWSRTWPFLLLVGAVLSFTRTLTPTLLVLAAAVLAAATYQLGRRVPPRSARWVNLVTVAGIVLGFYAPLLSAGLGWGAWGGLLMTLFAAIVAIAVSFPIGIVLALARRSNLPGIRVVAVGYIELIRGVPLITLLLMASFVVGFLVPPTFQRPGLVARALVVLVAFTAAYVAEIVRGGLQSVPRGQVEAAQAVGLSPWKVTRLVVLPQALRNVIPALVGQFISLFKDTSLLAVIGILELLQAAQVITQQPDFQAQGLIAETLGFAAFVYWVFAYAMSKESQRLERRLGLGER